MAKLTRETAPANQRMKLTGTAFWFCGLQCCCRRPRQLSLFVMRRRGDSEIRTCDYSLSARCAGGWFFGIDGGRMGGRWGKPAVSIWHVLLVFLGWFRWGESRRNTRAPSRVLSGHEMGMPLPRGGCWGSPWRISFLCRNNKQRAALCRLGGSWFHFRLLAVYDWLAKCSEIVRGKEPPRDLVRCWDGFGL